MAEQPAAGVGAREARARVGAVRAWWRVARPGRSVWAQLDAIYTVAITTAIFGGMLYGTASSALASSITPATAPEWGPALALVALVAIARWGTWQGPVVFAAPDVGFLLGAPLRRRALATRPLARAVAAGAGAGALVAAVALVGLGGDGRGVSDGTVAGLVIGLALLAVLGVALAGYVQCSHGWSRFVAVALPLSLAVGGGLVAAADASGSARTAVLWSGPWGWAVQPVADASTASAVAALAALAAVTALAVVGAWRAVGACATERHVARAEARSDAVASIWALDARTARLTLQRAAGAPRGRRAQRATADEGARPRGGRGATAGATARRRRGLRPPRQQALAIPWRDAVSALRAPGRTITGAVLGAAAAVLAVAAARHLAAEPLAAFGTYLAASTLLEPLRLETDQPTASQVLMTRPFGHVLLGHLAVPTAVIAVAATAAGVVVVATGAVEERAGALAIVAVAMVPAIVACAALSSRRGGRLPISVLTKGSAVDPSGGGSAIIGYILGWPIAGALIGSIPLVLVARATSLGGALTTAALVAVIAPAGLGYRLLGGER